ncbi:MAG: beta-galactosidase, partial [Chloroflexota bacterium]|nr:beta-galactosidase [Chloroflexota bacterium]
SKGSGFWPSLADRTAGLASGLPKNPDAVRALLAALLALAGVLLGGMAATADQTLHRGVETGAETPWVRQPTGRDLATNVDLTRFAPEQLDAVAAALQENGFRYVRQSFAWAQIEPARGAFEWQRYDAIVDALERHFVTPVAVLHRSPAWARLPEQAAAFDAPPAIPEDYETFVQAVVQRYGERVPYVQLWDLPNRADRWGGAPDAGAYRDLLARGSNAARGQGTNTTVVLAELDPAPTPNLAGDDLAFLRELYEADAAPFFQVVAARVDGGARSPFDRSVAPGIANLSRATLVREVMTEAGDVAKPIWATHYGWRAGDGPGAVDATDQAAFTLAGMERARAEWPWMGPLFAAGLVPGPALGGEVAPGEALFAADGSPSPLFRAFGDFVARGATEVAPTGFLPVDAPQVVLEGNWDLQHLPTTTYRTTREVGARATVRFAGTGIVALVRLGPEAGLVEAVLDGESIEIPLDAFQATDQALSLAEGLADGEHVLTVRLAEPGQLTIGGLQVVREVPLRWPVALLLGGGLALLFLGLRQIAYLVAERTGRLQRRRGVEFWPELPQIPDWRPARRA